MRSRANGSINKRNLDYFLKNLAHPSPKSVLIYTIKYKLIIHTLIDHVFPESLLYSSQETGRNQPKRRHSCSLLWLHNANAYPNGDVARTFQCRKVNL